MVVWEWCCVIMATLCVYSVDQCYPYILLISYYLLTALPPLPLSGAWSRPKVTGEIPPPSAGFTLTKISENTALFYGGFNPESGLCIKDAYVAELGKEAVVSSLPLFRVTSK